MLAANEQFTANSVGVEATTEIAPSTAKAQGRPSLGFRTDDAPQLASNIETAIPEPISASPPTIPIPADHTTTASTANLPLPAAGEDRGEGQRSNWFLPPALGFAWLATPAFLAVRLIRSLITTQRLLRRAVPCNDPTMVAAAAEAASRIGIACPPLLTSRDIETPTIYALGCPRLLIPLVEASLRDAQSELLPRISVVKPKQPAPSRVFATANLRSERRGHPQSRSRGSIGSRLFPTNWPTSPAATAGRGWAWSASWSCSRSNR